MSARQLIVLVVAAVAAIGALLIIRGMGSRQDAEPVAATENIAGEQVLVVTRDIPQGAALVPSDLAVRLFPQDSVSPQFVRISQQPSAQAEFVGAVTRRAFVQGEPLVAGSVVQPEGRGFLAAQLEPGFRAVAIEIEPSTSAGGYIQPNDRVDILMTARVQNAGDGEQMRSDVVVEDVRVLALDDIVQAQTAGEQPTRVTAAVAVLELSAGDARALALADAMGDITLALRGVEMEMVGQRNANAQNRFGGESGQVRVHAFGSVNNGGGR